MGNISRKRWVNEAENAAIPSSRVAATDALALQALAVSFDAYSSKFAGHFGSRKTRQTGTFHQTTSV
jgi:hypothetical protein